MLTRGQAVAFCDLRGGAVIDTTVAGQMLVFVDETGHEDFAPGHPFFGFGGIAVMASRYVAQVREPWFGLKERILGSADASFHAADFPKDGEHEGALCEFFRSAPFFRFAIVSPKPSAAPDWEVFPRGPGEIHPIYEALSLILRKVLVFAHDAQRCVVSRVAFAQEGSERADRMADRYFKKLALAVPHEDIPVRLLRTSKALCEPGCEVADFVANEGGRQLRSLLRGQTEVLRRFHNMFEAVPKPLRAYVPVRGIEIERTARRDAGGRLIFHAEVKIAYGVESATTGSAGTRA